MRATPLVMKGFEVLENVIVIEKWNLNGRKENGDPCVRTIVEQINVLFNLPYWKVCHLTTLYGHKFHF
jgi:hypothetical protein